GEENISVYRAKLANGAESPAERRFCADCGSGLWVWDPNRPELLHPHASAIDTDLPRAPEAAHIMLGSKAGWTAVQAEPGDKQFNEYPDESIAAWHQRLGLEC
ncbi:MAG: GFA family protein, partial [Pseudomonadota bacterium]